jgi:hypothetical protein
VGPGSAKQPYRLHRVRDMLRSICSSGRVKRTLALRINIDAKLQRSGERKPDHA